MYKYIHTCIYIHIHMSAHIHTNTYIHTRIQNVHMNARKARLKRRRRSDCARSPAAHLTITTVRRPDHIRLSALVRSQSAQFTQAPSLAARPWPPETSFRACIPMQKYIYRVIFIYIRRCGRCSMCIVVYVCVFVTRKSMLERTRAR